MTAIAILCLVILAVRHLVREESLKEAAEKCFAALERGDAKALLRYVSDAEIAALNLDEAKLSSLLNQFFLPSLEGFTPKGDVRFEPRESYGELEIERDYAHSDGREVTVLLAVTPSDRGPKLARATEDIFFSALRTYWPAGKRPPLERAAILHEFAMERAVPKIESLALPGYANNDEQNPAAFRVVTWKEWQEGVRRRAERIRAER